MRLSDCNNVMDLRRIAKHKLPLAVFDYLDGGADDELSLARNSDAFNDYELLPSQLSDVSNIDLKSTFALRDRLEIICDGGVRRGTHVVKARVLGANACSIGRGYLFGLAAGGQQGVERSLDLLRSEVERTMALLGCNSVGKLSRA